jgi:DNA-directed RNA polymerase specialized sigma24 family protein
MSADDFADWTAKNLAIYSLTDRAPSPCYDCTLDFALEQRAAGMCDAHPGGMPYVAPSITERSLAAVKVRKAKRDERMRRAVELQQSGLLQREIAAEMGFSQAAVGKWLRRWRAA